MKSIFNYFSSKIQRTNAHHAESSQQPKNVLQHATSIATGLPPASYRPPEHKNLLTDLPENLLEGVIFPKLSPPETTALRGTNKQFRSSLPVTGRRTNITHLHQTLQAINNEHTDKQSARDTDTLVITGAASLAHFNNLPTCPKVKKLVLELTPNVQSDITQETPLNIAKTFPSLTQISTNGLNPASGKIISEMLATETLKSLTLQNISKQEDTLSGPLHHISSNHLNELIYSETPEHRGKSARDDFFMDIQLNKLLETSPNLNTLSLSGEFDLSGPTPQVQALCTKVHKMSQLKHFEMKNAPRMAEEFVAYMVGECNKLEHLDLSNNPKGVGSSLKILLGQRADNPNQAILPELKHITFWNNAMIESHINLRGGRLHQQVANSLNELSHHKSRLSQLDLKVSDLVDEQVVIDATNSLRKGGILKLGPSQQVTENTVTKIRAKRPDLRIRFTPN
jgi:hypothetical protein